MKTDVIVIGSGFAGLMAALVSVAQGKKTAVLTYGMGTFALNSGVIDILGYDAAGKAVKNPLEAIKALPESHPYRKVGTEKLNAAVKFFLSTMEEARFGYIGSLSEQQWVPTAVGTMKPTCFVPKTMQGMQCFEKKKIIIVGIKGLKDFYADMMMENIKSWLGVEKSYSTAVVNPGFGEGRDATGADVARWLDTDEGIQSFASQMQSAATADAVLIMPQILGSEGLNAYEKLSARLGSSLVEATSLPPSTNGMRLYRALRKALHSKGVDIFENTQVVRGISEGNHAIGVVAKTSVREATYKAEKIILATGGFYSGGLVMRDFGKPRECIFDLPMEFDCAEEQWSNAELFGNEQGYAKAGIRTDASLRAVDEAGKIVLDNVYIAGRNLSGYDFCHEQSGNGVALATAYQAAMA